MDLKEIFLPGGLGLAALLTLIQIAPVKIDPWTSIAKALGKAINGEVLREMTVTPGWEPPALLNDFYDEVVE